MKKIMLLSGSGFSDYSELAFLFNSADVQFETFDVNVFGYSIHNFSDMELDGLIFGAPYSLAPHELLMDKLLAKKVAPILDLCWERKIKVLGLGRGALIFWEWMLGDKWRRWKAARTWNPGEALADCEIFVNNNWRHLPCGRLGEEIIVPQHADFTKWETFVRHSEETLGWNVGTFYLSLVDVLAYMNKSQIEDYGYSTEFSKNEFSGLLLKDIFEVS
jgi:hypothetical protein